MMRASNRLTIISAIILALSIQVHAEAKQRGPHIQANVPTLQSKPSTLQNSIDRIASALEAENNKRASKEEVEQAKENLASQLAMASAAKVMIYVGIAEAFITFCGVLLVLATLIYTKRAAEAARDSADYSKHALTNVERPYVFIYELSALHRGEYDMPPPHFQRGELRKNPRNYRKCENRYVERRHAFHESLKLHDRRSPHCHDSCLFPRPCKG